jgi:hypothetical protein
MIHGSWVTATIGATPAVTSGEVDLGRPYETAVVVCPALTTSATVSFTVAEKTGGTFQALYMTDPASGNNIQVKSGAFTSANFTWVVPIGGFQFIKVVLSAAQAAGKTFRIMGIRS